MRRTKSGKNRNVASGNRIETLESRQLLSVALGSDGVLNIVQAPAAPGATVDISLNWRPYLIVVENGQMYKFVPGQVKKIYFSGSYGNDRLTVSQNVTIPVEAYGRQGNDTLTGGSSGHDTLWGQLGDDMIVSHGAADQINGGYGNDRLTATGASAVVTMGGAGDDIIYAPKATIISNGTTRNIINRDGAITVQPMIRSQVFKPGVFIDTVTGLDPHQVRKAYGFGNLDDPTYTNRGAGQTIYLVEAFTGLNVTGDFAFFCNQFELPAPTAQNFQIVNANSTGRSPAVDSLWSSEINLDLQWARAIAPEARIVVVQADSAMSTDVVQAVHLAADLSESGGGGIVCMSLGFYVDPISLPFDSAVWDGVFSSHPGTSFIASSGDVGSVMSYPAISPFVTGVGGTVLSVNAAGTRNADEIGWPKSSGGVSLAYQTPSYQQNLTYPTATGTAVLVGRGSPDVSYNAENFAIYNSTPDQGNKGWFSAGGTSAGAPQWAALTALVNQQRKTLNKAPIGANLNGALYEAYSNDYVNSGLVDILTGSANNGAIGTGNVAGPKYDLVTGLGVPNAGRLISTLSDTNPFFMQGNLQFKSNFSLSKDFAVGAEPQLAGLLFGQDRTGTGTITGGNIVDLTFQTKSSTFGDPNRVEPLDYYSNGLGQNIQLYRTPDGRIYGNGFATIMNADGFVGPASVTFQLKFEGTWVTAANGKIASSVSFYAVDQNGNAIEKSVFKRSNVNYQGCNYTGSFTSV